MRSGLGEKSKFYVASHKNSFCQIVGYKLTKLLEIFS